MVEAETDFFLAGVSSEWLLVLAKTGKAEMTNNETVKNFLIINTKI